MEAPALKYALRPPAPARPSILRRGRGGARLASALPPKQQPLPLSWQSTLQRSSPAARQRRRLAVPSGSSSAGSESSSTEPLLADERSIQQPEHNGADTDAASKQPQPAAAAAVDDSTAEDSSAATAPVATPTRSPAFLALSILSVVVFAVSNRVLYKMAVTPLANYIFFLAQFQTFGYVGAFAVLLLMRKQAGRVTPAMLQIPRLEWKLFLAIGCVEALSAFLHFIGAAHLPGVVLPLLSQTVLFWQLLLGYLFLRKRLSAPQMMGCALVVSGVCLAAWPGGAGSIASPLKGVDPRYALLFVFSNLFPALDTILKERIFTRSRERLGGKDLDLFVVNTFGSLSQAVFVAAMLPLITGIRGMPLAELPGYLARGWQCFQGLTPSCGSDCTGAPLIPLLYVFANLGFNVSILNLIRAAGNVTISLVMSATVPLTIYAFTVPLPYLPASPALSPNFVAGAGILLMGLMTYNAPVWYPALLKTLASKVNGGSDGSAGARKQGATAGA